MILVFIILIVFLFVFNRNLMLVLIMLEILGFVLLFYVSVFYSIFSTRDYFVLMVFSILVIEGVIALCGLIMLVRHTGRDYLKTRTFLK